jgi:hypothetical protein
VTIVTGSAEATAGANSIATPARNMTGMTLFVVAVSSFGTSDAATPITDTSGNTYTLISRSANFSGGYSSIHYCASPTVSASQTFTYHTSSTGDFPSIAVLGWDGAAPVTFDTAPAWVGTTGTNPLNTNNTATTAQASELIVSMLGGSNGGGTITAADHGTTAATWTTDEQQTSNAGEPIALAHALPANGPGSYGVAWTNPNGAAECNVAAFKATTGGGGLPPGLGPNEMMDEPGMTTSYLAAMMR